jgi:hypothetical protein
MCTIAQLHVHVPSELPLYVHKYSKLRYDISFVPPQTVTRGSSGTADEKSVQMSKVMNDIHQMKGRQESIATVLDVLKQ